MMVDIILDIWKINPFRYLPAPSMGWCGGIGVSVYYLTG